MSDLNKTVDGKLVLIDENNIQSQRPFQPAAERTTWNYNGNSKPSINVNCKVSLSVVKVSGAID